jgi:hypothetical protein
MLSNNYPTPSPVYSHHHHITNNLSPLESCLLACHDLLPITMNHDAPSAPLLARCNLYVDRERERESSPDTSPVQIRPRHSELPGHDPPRQETRLRRPRSRPCTVWGHAGVPEPGRAAARRRARDAVAGAAGVVRGAVDCADGGRAASSSFLGRGGRDSAGCFCRRVWGIGGMRGSRRWWRFVSAPRRKGSSVRLCPRIRVRRKMTMGWRCSVGGGGGMWTLSGRSAYSMKQGRG